MSEKLPARSEQGAIAHRVDLAETQALGALLAKSGYFQDAREAAQAAVKVMAGAELGLPPIASMMGINIIKGKVALGAHLIAAQVRRHGYDVRVKQLDTKGCVLLFLDKEDAKGKRGELGESSFQEADAKAAKCFSEMYEKFPRNMYYSRSHLERRQVVHAGDIRRRADLHAGGARGAGRCRGRNYPAGRAAGRGDRLAQEPRPRRSQC